MLVGELEEGGGGWWVVGRQGGERGREGRGMRWVGGCGVVGGVLVTVEARLGCIDEADFVLTRYGREEVVDFLHYVEMK